jgi:hypothetical protein
LFLVGDIDDDDDDDPFCIKPSVTSSQRSAQKETEKGEENLL